MNGTKAKLLDSSGRDRDALTEVLLNLRLDGLEYGRCHLRAPWAVAFPAQPSARFHFMAHGDCWLRAGDAPWLQLRQGDAVLLPRGEAHILASSRDVPAVDIATLARVPVADAIYLVGGERADAGEATHT